MSSNWTRQVFENLDQLRLVRTDYRTPNVLVYVKSEKSWYRLNSDPYTPDEKPPYIIKPINGVGSWRMANPDKTFVPVVELVSLESVFMDGTFKSADWFEPTNWGQNSRPQKSIIKRLQRFCKSIFIFKRFSEGLEYTFKVVNNSALPDTYWKADNENIKVHVLDKKALLQMLLFLYGCYAPFFDGYNFSEFPGHSNSVFNPKPVEYYQENALLELLIGLSNQTISLDFEDEFILAPTASESILFFESKIFNQTLAEYQRVYLPLVYNPEPQSPHSKGVFSVPPLDDISTELFKPPYNFGDNITLHNHPWSEPISISMIEIPAGQFQRNSTASNIAVISQPFFMSKTLVTRYQFGSIMNYDPSNMNMIFDKSEIYLDEPVRNIGWVDAVAFCIKLSLIEGLDPVYKIDRNVSHPDVLDLENQSYLEFEIRWLVANTAPTQNGTWYSFEETEALRNGLIVDFSANGYRLPTEMEYMWAMMGAPSTGQGGNTDTNGYTKMFAGSDGSNSVNDYTVNQTNSGVGGTTTTPLTTRFVASKLPNEIGLYDMSGNVFCYLHDRSATIPSGTIIDYTNNTTNTNNRVIKGGAFNRPTSELRVDFRSSNNIYNSPPANVGFRVVRKVV